MKKPNLKLKVSVFLVASLFLMTTIISSTTATESHHYPVYDDTSFPSQLEPGDLLFMDVKQWVVDRFDVPHVDNIGNEKSNDHVILYIGIESGVHTFIEANDYTFYLESGNFTLPGDKGVQKNPWWKFAFWATNFTIGKVTNATPQQKQKAIDHATALLGYDYQSAFVDYPPWFQWSDPNVTDPLNPYYHSTYYYPIDPWVDKYYCAELVHACYLNIMPSPINLDPYPEHDGHYMSNPTWGIYPWSLLHSTNMTFIEVTETSIFSEKYCFLQEYCYLKESNYLFYER